MIKCLMSSNNEGRDFHVQIASVVDERNSQDVNFFVRSRAQDMGRAASMDRRSAYIVQCC
jgi:hypothetical protein